MSESIKNRLLGLFMGQLVGDALGTRYEFSSCVDVKKVLISETKNHQLKILGGGPFHISAGRFTDDSELALGIWYSLLKKNKYDIVDISKIFYKWIMSEPIDIGKATINAFQNGDTYEKMKNNANANKHSLSNGCLMKISPIGAISLLNYHKDIKKCAKEICELTNPHPICIDMCVAYTVAIQEALITGDAIKAYLKAQSTANHNLTKLILQDALHKNNPVRIMNNVENEKEGYSFVDTDKKCIGYIGIAFQNAFYQLLHAKKENGFYNCMINTILLGGDTDTNACIAGALYASCYGITCIPRDWLESVYKSQDDRYKVYEPANNNYVFNMLKNKLNL